MIIIYINFFTKDILLLLDTCCWILCFLGRIFYRPLFVVILSLSSPWFLDWWFLITRLLSKFTTVPVKTLLMNLLFSLWYSVDQCLSLFPISCHNYYHHTSSIYGFLLLILYFREFWIIVGLTPLHPTMFPTHKKLRNKDTSTLSIQITWRMS